MLIVILIVNSLQDDPEVYGKWIHNQAEKKIDVCRINLISCMLEIRSFETKKLRAHRRSIMKVFQ